MRSHVIKRVGRYLAAHDPELVRILVRWDTGEVQYGTDDERKVDSFPIAEAVWHFCADWHGGQFSDLYRAMCASEFSPGAWGGISEDAHLIYLELSNVEEGRVHA